MHWQRVVAVSFFFVVGVIGERDRFAALAMTAGCSSRICRSVVAFSEKAEGGKPLPYGEDALSLGRGWIFGKERSLRCARDDEEKRDRFALLAMTAGHSPRVCRSIITFSTKAEGGKLYRPV